MRFGQRVFFPSLYRKIKDQNPSISEDFTKTFLKWPRDRLETMTSMLVSQRGKTFCASFCASLIACVCLSRSVRVRVIIVHSICELILCAVLRLLSPGWIKTCLYSVISSYGYFFYMPRFIYLCKTSFILVFSQRTVMLRHASEQTCALLSF